MRTMNKIKIFTAGSAMLITSAAMAGPPVAYNGFTSAGGTITADTSFCTGPGATFSCSTPLTGNGFLQRSITELSSGTTYFQTIILPTNANVTTAGDVTLLPFADENFVQQGGGTGIADQQSNYALHTTANPGDFSSTTQINAGWANTGGDVVTLTQQIDDTYNATTNPNGSDFVLNFGLTGDGTQATSLHINQVASLCADVTDPLCTDRQQLDVRRLIASSGGNTVALPTGPGLQGSASIAYSTNDIIQAVWLGQGVTTSGPAQDLSGFQGYTNITTTDTNGYSSQTETGPWNYDPVFNTGGLTDPVF